MKYPTTSHLPISAERIARFISEARRTFDLDAISRELLRPVGAISDNALRKIGINHIVDRIWFVEGVFNGHYFASPSGAPYGSAVAEGEAKLVLDEFVRHVTADCTTEIAGDPSEADVVRLLSVVRGRGFDPSVILTNIYQDHLFWDYQNFEASPERTGLKSPFGRFQGVAVIYSRLLPNGLTIAADGGATGTLKIKSDFQISVDELKDELREDVRKQLKLSEAELAEKVRVFCQVVVKPEVASPSENAAFQIMLTKGTELKIEIPKTGS